jgi:hypothetical protein
MKTRKTTQTLLFILCIALTIDAHALYKCNDSTGQISYQQRPCATDEEEAKISGQNSGNHHSADEKKKLILSMGKMLGKELDPNDPKMLQAAEAMLVTDAAKAYAFTKIYGVSLEFCPDNKALIDAMNNYKRTAENHIKLGAIYYRDGVDLQIGEKRFKHSGQELTQGLDGMLEDLRNKHRKNAEKNCRESTNALNTLAKLYATGP